MSLVADQLTIPELAEEINKEFGERLEDPQLINYEAGRADLFTIGLYKILLNLRRLPK